MLKKVDPSFWLLYSVSIHSDERVVFDALTSTRSYRPAFNWQKALSILAEEAGKTVDPHLQKLFDRVIRETLENDPGAWERMVQSADQFALVL